MIAEITKDYIELSRRWGRDDHNFPIDRLGTSSEDGEYFEFDEKNGLSLVILERGEVQSRRSTNSKGEFLYWIFRGQANSIGIAHAMKNRELDSSFHRVFYNKAINELARVRRDWAKRLCKEFAAAMGDEPFHDDLKPRYLTCTSLGEAVDT